MRTRWLFPFTRPPAAPGRHRPDAKAVLAGVLAAVVVAVSVVAVVRATSGTAGHRVRSAAAAGVTGARHSATRKVLDQADDLPADCVPNPAGPPGDTYQLGLVGTVRGGTLTTPTATVANINANFCGVVTVVNGKPPCGATGSVSSPQDGQVFGPLSVELTLVPGMSPTIGFTANAGTISGGFGCEASSANGLQVDLNATVSGTTGALFGVSCTLGPFTLPLTGDITGPFTDLTGTLMSNDFTIPDVQGSPTCPGSVPANIDAIAGLPLAPGTGQATLPVSASLYQPG